MHGTNAPPERGTICNFESAPSSDQNHVHVAAFTCAQSVICPSAPGPMRILRVNQLDAQVLDDQIAGLLQPHWERIFERMAGPDFIEKYEPEVSATLKGLIFALSRLFCHQSYADKLHNLVYRNEFAAARGGHAAEGFAARDTRPPIMQQLACGVTAIGLHYLFAKINKHSIEQQWSDLPDTSRRKRLWHALNRLEPYLKLIACVNFLVFLVHGRYRSLWDRLFGLRLVLEKRHVLRQVNFDYMDQQLVWQGVAQFLAFATPFIRLGTAWGWPGLGSWRGTPRALSAVPAAPETCAICAAPMEVPYTAQCGHAFCYYCVQSRMMAHATYRCPMCTAVVAEVWRKQS